MFPHKLSPQTLLIQVVSTLALTLIAALHAAAQPVTVVEYYNRAIDAHFITGRANEQTALDAVADFRRTGMTFQATAVATAASGLTKICRFYISIATPYVSSHFYGRQGIDCESIRALSPAGFSWEDYDFATQQPSSGVCPAGTTAIFRGFRAAAGGKTSNHRYSASQATYDAAVAAGYAGEGVAFCVAVATVAVAADSWVGTGKSVTCTEGGCGSNGAAEVTWTLDKTVNNVATYVPGGTASLVGLPCSFAPSSVAIKSDDGFLTVNYNTNPPTYQGYGSSGWMAVVTCPGGGGSVAGIAGAVFFGGSKGPGGAFAEGLVSGGGLTIDGSDTLVIPGVSTTRFDWHFTRKP